jgi:GMP synthase (glutamine-hydrolysing)
VRPRRSSRSTPRLREASAIDVLVLQHIACEPPGLYEEVLRERRARLERIELDDGDPLPEDPRDFDALIVMGGPMGANDDAVHPWLTGEKRLIAAAVRLGVPLFGVCLGAQLLAASLGARVYRGPRPEVGVLPVTLTEEARDDPVFSALPRELLSLQWHSDTFDLPEGAVRLAGSPAYPNQAYRLGGVAYAVQFHLEVSQAMACEWAAVPEYEQALESTEGKGAFDRLLSSFEAASADLLGHARTLFERWLELAVAT